MRGVGQVQAGLARLAEDCTEQSLLVLKLGVAERRRWRDWTFEIAFGSDVGPMLLHYFVGNWSGNLRVFHRYLQWQF